MIKKRNQIAMFCLDNESEPFLIYDKSFIKKGILNFASRTNIAYKAKKEKVPAKNFVTR